MSIKHSLYFKDDVLFALSYERVVHGGRGDYVELIRDQIVVNLHSHFKQDMPDEITNEDFFYYWCEPLGRDEKIYWQCNTVNYADYKIGFYYISPKLLKLFDNKELF